MNKTEPSTMTAATIVRTCRAGTRSTIQPQAMLPSPRNAALSPTPTPANTGLSPSSRRNAARWVFIPACIRNSSPVPVASIHSAGVFMAAFRVHPGSSSDDDPFDSLVCLVRLVAVWSQSDVFRTLSYQ